MSKARDLADFQGSASALTTGTLPVDRVPYVGRRNVIINGGFDVWQRGTSFTDSTSYTADRWWNFPQGTISSYRDADVGMCAKYATNGTGGYYYAFRQRIEYENVRHMEGKTVTLSFKVKASQAFTGRMMAYFVHTNYFIQPYDITTEWTTVTKTFTFPVSGVTPNFDQEMFEFILLEQLPSTATDIYITQVQFELGSVATPFEHRSYGEELALCQRYYIRQTYEALVYQHVHFGMALNTAYCAINIEYPVTMRGAPTLQFSSASSFRVNDGLAHDETCNNIVQHNTTKEMMRIHFYKATANMNVGYCAYINRETFSSPCWLAFDAEL